nr:uncharacterized protein LOC109159653 [Ipomoea batatas]
MVVYQERDNSTCTRCDSSTKYARSPARQTSFVITKLRTLSRSEGSPNTTTAHGQKHLAESTGFSGQFCDITAEPKASASYLVADRGNIRSIYLDRAKSDKMVTMQLLVPRVAPDLAEMMALEHGFLFFFLGESILDPGGIGQLGTLRLVRVERGSIGSQGSDYCRLGQLWCGRGLRSDLAIVPVLVSRSSSEAEYRALAATVCEVQWITYLFKDLQIQLSKPATLFCDNKSAIAIDENYVFHERTKHIDIDCHIVREKVLHHSSRPRVGSRFSSVVLLIFALPLLQVPLEWCLLSQEFLAFSVYRHLLQGLLEAKNSLAYDVVAMFLLRDLGVFEVVESLPSEHLLRLPFFPYSRPNLFKRTL